MSGLPWNYASPRTCHCDSCDGPDAPACEVCGADGVDIDEWGNCPDCRPLEEETCEAYEARMRDRRAK